MLQEEKVSINSSILYKHKMPLSYKKHWSSSWATNTMAHKASAVIPQTKCQCMPVYLPAVASTHCAYTQRDGQAE